MRHLTLNEVLELYRRLVERYGGSVGIHDLGALESALAQPRMTFGGEKIILEVASGELTREAFTGWLRDHIREKKND
jgi:prophage maintenance system killer protein